MTKVFNVGDEIVNERNIKCTIIAHEQDFYLIETPTGEIENITEKEIQNL